MPNKKELWRDIPGFEGSYQISSYGRVASLPRLTIANNVQLRKFKLLKLHKIKPANCRFCGNPSRGGIRLRVDLRDGSGIKKSFAINRLVAEAFIPNPLKNPMVIYLDSNKKNNHADNLKWATVSEMYKYTSKFKKRGAPRGKYNYRSKKIIQYHKTGKFKMKFHGISEAARRTKITRTCIQGCLSGELKTAGGFIWKYVKSLNEESKKKKCHH